MITHISINNYQYKSLQTKYSIKILVNDYSNQGLPIGLNGNELHHNQPIYIPELINRPSKFSEEGQQLIKRSLQAIKSKKIREEQTRKGQYAIKKYTIPKEVKRSWFTL